LLTLADVIEALTGTRPSMVTPIITEATIDSRQVIPGGLFVAIPGERADGHDFVAEAFKRGASFAFIQREIEGDYPTLDLRSGFEEGSLTALTPPFSIRVDDSLAALQQTARFWRSRLDVRVIGITGSVGKSTTKELVAQVLSQRYRTLKNLGNLNNEIGLPLTLLRLGEGYQRAVLEMGFYLPGEIAFLCEIARPSVGIVTWIGTVHAERAGSREVIAQGKGELVEALPDDGVAILNYDNSFTREMATRAQARVMYYGLDRAAHLWADQIESFGLEGIRFRMHYKDEVMHVRAPLIGRHSVHNALAAVAAGLTEGLTWDEILNGLTTAYTQLRLVAVRSESGALLLDDTYNASPESMLAALNLLDEMEGRKIAVLGDMLELGQYERQGHELVGRRAAEVADVLITLGERARTIAEAALRGGLKRTHILEFSGQAEVTAWLDANLTASDIVLLKGSHGLRMDRIVTALETAE
jgi:UDP-N-acetylmuramoyl-tripeptide--D-alanyl-D-alanine ligase